MNDNSGRRRKWAVALTVFVATVLTVAFGGVWLSSRLKSPEQALADAQPPAPSLVTAKAELRMLSDAVLLRGKVRPGKARSITAPVGLSGDTAVVTKVPVRRGDRLTEGTVILEIAGAPVFALRTRFPFYRDIVDGMSGPDVLELQRTLARLGYRVQSTGRFDRATQESLERLYTAHDYKVPRKSSGSGAQTAATAFLKRSHMVRIGRGQTVTGVPVKVGDTLKPASVILKLDAAKNTVNAVVASDQLSSVTIGAEAEVTDEIRKVTARAVVSSVSTEPTQSEQGAGFDVEFSFVAKSLKATPNHTVRITVGASSESARSLAVPVTAIFSRPDGTTYLKVLDGEATASGQQTTDVDVRTGDSAGGWVAIEPRDSSLVKPGSDVVVGLSIASSPSAGTGETGD